MKRLLFFEDQLAIKLGLLLALALFLTACQKQENLPEVTSESPINTAASLEKPLYFPTLNQSIPQLIADAEDVENERVNLGLFLFGAALNDLIQTSSGNSLLAGILNTRKNLAETSLLAILDENPALLPAFQNSIHQALNTMMQDFKTYGGIELDALQNSEDLIVAVAELLHYKESSYLPVVYALRPYEEISRIDALAIGEAIPQGPEEESFRDCVAGWEAGGVVEICPDAFDAFDGVVVFVGNGGDCLECPLEDDETGALEGDQKLRIKQYQVKNPYRFDRGDTDLRIVMGVTEGNSRDFIPEDTWEKGYGIKKKDVGNSKVFNVNDDFGSYSANSFGPGSVKNYYFLAYEKDWWAKVQPNKCFCDCRETNFLEFGKIRMKYEHEYYLKKCGQASTIFTFVNAVLDVSNERSRFKVQRTE